jgi:hypothetical protein
MYLTDESVLEIGLVRTSERFLLWLKIILNPDSKSSELRIDYINFQIRVFVLRAMKHFGFISPTHKATSLFFLKKLNYFLFDLRKNN